jgi:hypothetical protein
MCVCLYDGTNTEGSVVTQTTQQQPPPPPPPPQPPSSAGVGFSYASTADNLVDTEEEVGEDLYQFLQSFFAANPRFATNPFYVFGESYGGHYVPAVGHRIFEANQQQAAGGKEQQTRINLKVRGFGWCVCVLCGCVCGCVCVCPYVRTVGPRGFENGKLWRVSHPSFLKQQGLGIGNGLTDPEVRVSAWSCLRRSVATIVA